MTVSWSLMVMTTGLYYPSEGKAMLVPAQRSAQQEPPKSSISCHEYLEMWRNSSLCQAVPVAPFNPFLDFTVSWPLVLLELTKLGWAFIYDFLFHMTPHHTKSSFFPVDLDNNTYVDFFSRSALMKENTGFHLKESNSKQNWCFPIVTTSQQPWQAGKAGGNGQEDS